MKKRICLVTRVCIFGFFSGLREIAYPASPKKGEAGRQKMILPSLSSPAVRRRKKQTKTAQVSFLAFAGSFAMHFYRVYLMEAEGKPVPKFWGASVAFSLYGAGYLILLNYLGKLVLNTRRCCLCMDPIYLLMLPPFIAYNMALWAYLEIFSRENNEWNIVFFRVIFWPLLAELIGAPLRQKLRELNPEETDKEGMAR